MNSQNRIYILTVKNVSQLSIYQNDIVFDKFCKIKILKYYMNSQTLLCIMTVKDINHLNLSKLRHFG